MPDFTFTLTDAEAAAVAAETNNTVDAYLGSQVRALVDLCSRRQGKEKELKDVGITADLKSFGVTDAEIDVIVAGRKP